MKVIRCLSLPKHLANTYAQMAFLTVKLLLALGFFKNLLYRSVPIPSSEKSTQDKIPPLLFLILLKLKTGGSTLSVLKVFLWAFMGAAACN